MNAPVLTHQQQTTWNRYQRMRVRLAEQLNRELAHETGLSEADYEILVALTENPDQSMRAIALRCGLEWEKSRLSHQLRRMEQRGLVARETCIEDNRSTIIRVTAEGRALACQAKQVHEAAVRRHVGDILTPAQLAALDDIATAILATLDSPNGHA